MSGHHPKEMRWTEFSDPIQRRNGKVLEMIELAGAEFKGLNVFRRKFGDDKAAMARHLFNLDEEVDPTDVQLEMVDDACDAIDALFELQKLDDILDRIRGLIWIR